MSVTEYFEQFSASTIHRLLPSYARHLRYCLPHKHKESTLYNTFFDITGERTVDENNGILQLKLVANNKFGVTHVNIQPSQDKKFIQLSCENFPRKKDLPKTFFHDQIPIEIANKNNKPQNTQTPTVLNHVTNLQEFKRKKNALPQNAIETIQQAISIQPENETNTKIIIRTPQKPPTKAACAYIKNPQPLKVVLVRADDQSEGANIIYQNQEIAIYPHDVQVAAVLSQVQEKKFKPAIDHETTIIQKIKTECSDDIQEIINSTQDQEEKDRLDEKIHADIALYAAYITIANNLDDTKAANMPRFAKSKEELSNGRTTSHLFDPEIHPITPETDTSNNGTAQLRVFNVAAQAYSYNLDSKYQCEEVHQVLGECLKLIPQTNDQFNDIFKFPKEPMAGNFQFLAPWVLQKFHLGESEHFAVRGFTGTEISKGSTVASDDFHALLVYDQVEKKLRCTGTSLADMKKSIIDATVDLTSLMDGTVRCSTHNQEKLMHFSNILEYHLSSNPDMYISLAKDMKESNIEAQFDPAIFDIKSPKEIITALEFGLYSPGSRDLRSSKIANTLKLEEDGDETGVNNNVCLLQQLVGDGVKKEEGECLVRLKEELFKGLDSVAPKRAFVQAIRGSKMLVHHQALVNGKSSRHAIQYALTGKGCGCGCKPKEDASSGGMSLAVKWTLVVVGIVVVLGGAGYYVYRKIGEKTQEEHDFEAGLM